jgi:hypothetical protein
VAVDARCPRCGAELAADATACPTCAYGEVEDIVLLEAQAPGVARQTPATSSPLPRVLAAVAILVVVIGAIFAVLR